MWVLSGDGMQMVNLDHAKRVFLNDLGDNVLIGVDLRDSSKIAPLGKYREMETARRVLADLITSFTGDTDFYIMPNNGYDVVYESRIMDSRVKRRGGS